MSVAEINKLKWYRKKRNIARLGVLTIWIIGSAAVFAIYRLEERTVLWTQLSMSSAALLLYSFFIPYLADRVKKRYVASKVNVVFGFFYAMMLLYILAMLGTGLLDIAQGPVTKQVTIEDRWDPSRGGDKVTTSEGDTYEVYAERVRMQEGHTYEVKIFKYSRIIIGMASVR